MNMSLYQFFAARMDECGFASELGARLEKLNLDSWPNLDARIRYLAKGQHNTAEKIVDDLFADSADADEFVSKLFQPAPVEA